MNYITQDSFESNVRVAVRIRPISKKEEDTSAKEIITVVGNSLHIRNVKIEGDAEIGDSRERLKTFTFDYVYPQSGDTDSELVGSQEQIFQDLGTDLLENAFDGYNSCVFAYGMTGTGKSYTMMGFEEQRGLIPRIAEGLFSRLSDAANESKVTTRVHASFLEIYNERVRDLLGRRQANERYTLKVREHPKEGPYVQDLSQHRVTDNGQIQELIAQGNSRRVTAATTMHDFSSRSHSIFTIIFTQATISEECPREISSKIHLVDLAGSERIDSDATSRSRLKESANINRSLVTLAKVIQNLANQSLISWNEQRVAQQTDAASADEQRRTRRRHIHIPYRDSVLTWLIKDSLGGNSNTTMIATVTPADIYYNETINTLRYAQQAKNIVNRPSVNEDPTAKLISTLRMEIQRLHEELANRDRVQSMDNLQVILSEKNQEADILTQQWQSRWQEGLTMRPSVTGGVLLEAQAAHLLCMSLPDSPGIHYYPLEREFTCVGSGSDADLRLQHPSILEKHCRLVSSEDSTVLLERNPRALVLVCGRQMADESVELFTGDTIQFGFLQALFYFNSPKQSFSRQISSTEDLDSQRAQSPSCSETIGESSSLSTSSLDIGQEYETKFSTDELCLSHARKDLDALTMEELKIKETLSENVEKLFRTHDMMRSTEEKKEVQLQDTLSRLEMQRSLTSSDLESMQTAASQQVEQQEQRVSETMARLRARKKSLAVIRHRLDSGATEDDRDAELGERLGSAGDSEGLHETVESKQAEVSELERLLEAEQAELDEARRRHAEALEQQQAALHAQTERAEEVRRRRRALEQYVERKTDNLFKKKNLTPPTRRRISGRQLEKVRSDNDIGLLPVVAPEADYPEEVGPAEIEQPNASRQASTKRKQLKTSKRAQAVTSRLYPGQPPSTEARRRLTSGGSAEGAASRLRSAQSAPHLELSQAADAAGATVEETTVSLRRGGSRRVQTKFTPEGRFLSGEIVSRTTGPAAAPVGPSSLSASAARLSGGSSLLSVPEESLEDLTAEAKTAAGGGYKFAPGDRRSLPVGALSAAADKTSTAVKRRSGGHLRERQSPSQRQQQHQKQKTKRQSTNIQPQVEMSRQPITLEVSPYRQIVLEQLTSHEAPPRHSVEFYYDLAGENPATKGAEFDDNDEYNEDTQSVDSLEDEPNEQQQQQQPQQRRRPMLPVAAVSASVQQLTINPASQQQQPPYSRRTSDGLVSGDELERNSVSLPDLKGSPASTAPAAAGPRPLPHPSSIYTEQSGPMPMTPRPAALMEDSLEGADISSAEEKREQREREKNAQAAASKAGEDGAEAAAESAAGNTSDEAEGSLDSLGSDSASVPSSGKVEVAKTGENLNEEELKEAKVATVATAGHSSTGSQSTLEPPSPKLTIRPAIGDSQSPSAAAEMQPQQPPARMRPRRDPGSSSTSSTEAGQHQRPLSVKLRPKRPASEQPPQEQQQQQQQQQQQARRRHSSESSSSSSSARSRERSGNVDSRQSRDSQMRWSAASSVFDSAPPLPQQQQQPERRDACVSPIEVTTSMPTLAEAKAKFYEAKQAAWPGNAVHPASEQAPPSARSAARSSGGSSSGYEVPEPRLTFPRGAAEPHTGNIEQSYRARYASAPRLGHGTVAERHQRISVILENLPSQRPRPKVTPVVETSTTTSTTPIRRGSAAAAIASRGSSIADLVAKVHHALSEHPEMSSFGRNQLQLLRPATTSSHQDLRMEEVRERRRQMQERQRLRRSEEALIIVDEPPPDELEIAAAEQQRKRQSRPQETRTYQYSYLAEATEIINTEKSGDSGKASPEMSLTATLLQTSFAKPASPSPPKSPPISSDANAIHTPESNLPVILPTLESKASENLTTGDGDDGAPKFQLIHSVRPLGQKKVTRKAANRAMHKVTLGPSITCTTLDVVDQNMRTLRSEIIVDASKDGRHRLTEKGFCLEAELPQCELGKAYDLGEQFRFLRMPRLAVVEATRSDNEPKEDIVEVKEEAALPNIVIVEPPVLSPVAAASCSKEDLREQLLTVHSDDVRRHLMEFDISELLATVLRLVELTDEERSNIWDIVRFPGSDTFGKEYMADVLLRKINHDLAKPAREPSNSLNDSAISSARQQRPLQTAIVGGPPPEGVLDTYDLNIGTPPQPTYTSRHLGALRQQLYELRDFALMAEEPHRTLISKIC
ncbi:hypothetical protein BOX15_Mlig029284g1 [Macrostomum lignano]|uniref:Kinesin motor domain-containing protein n=1 Tax=Macrostomum lignano TaxID=282301 RepID=A0A267G4H4_9PLAT|nr:hypothetical protein BOX15_Mlig029284g1 [Macrostomum lignano]